MLIIRHRVNKISELKQTPRELGVEIDIRGYGKELLLNHNPLENPEKYDRLEDYLKEFDHSFVIFNLKEAGYEQKIIDLAKKNGIENYFLLDVEFPYFYNATRKQGFRKIAVRYSEAEPIEFSLAQKGLVDWVWVDTNTKLPLNQEIYSRFKDAGFKLCLVCPERWGRPKDIDNYQRLMKEDGIKPDAVMTSLDNVEKWKNY
ncbi:Uncharacterised protein [uncultured archaeon]|nr:Uncharacterised protein [uncultured archaeon]